MTSLSAAEFLNSMDYLEPKCKKCNSVIEYGVTTHYEDSEGTHVCSKCNCPIE